MADERRVTVPREFQTGQPEDQTRELSATVRGLLKGQTNNYYLVELAVNATETVVLVEYARPGGIASFHPASSSGADEVALGGVWTTVEQGQFTVHHSNSATEGREIGVILAG